MNEHKIIHITLKLKIINNEIVFDPLINGKILIPLLQYPGMDPYINKSMKISTNV